MQSSIFYKFSLIALGLVIIFAVLSADKRAGYLDVKAPKGVIHAIVASSSLERETGLSGRKSLAKDSGMLFIFSQPGNYGFWMKNMNFPLDIIWINEFKDVAGIAANISPQTFPEVISPPQEIKYVLELNSGGAKDYGIATGTKLVF